MFAAVIAIPLSISMSFQGSSKLRAPTPVCTIGNMAGNKTMADYANKQYIPADVDDHSTRPYWKWEGRCPAENDCRQKSVHKLKAKLWSYESPEAVRDLVHHHLTHSSHHELSREDAHEWIGTFLEQEDAIFSYEETFDHREACRMWTDEMNHVNEKLHAAEDNAAFVKTLRSTLRTVSHGKTVVTSMLHEALAVIIDASCGTDGDDLLETVAMFADAGDVVKTKTKKKRQSADEAAIVKRKKMKATLVSDDLKSIGHVLVRAKSDMIHMKMEAENMRDQAAVLSMNFERHEMLIQQCQSDLAKIITLAVAAIPAD